jgi:nucleotide-binding universal stress UspA family protein
MTSVELRAVLAGTVVLASMLSVELGISVALLELALGVVVANAFDLDPGTTVAGVYRPVREHRAHVPGRRQGGPDDFREGVRLHECPRAGRRLRRVAQGARLRAVTLRLGRGTPHRIGRRGQAPRVRRLPGEVEEVKREKDEFFAHVLAEAQRTADQRGVPVRTELVPGHAAEVITHYAAAHGDDLIVIGHRGHFLGDVLLGSTADRVAHHAQCPVMVVR